MPSLTTAAIDHELASAAAHELEDALKNGMRIESALSLLGDFQKEATMSANTVGKDDNAGTELVTLWHTLTGEPHPTPIYMVEKYVRRRFPREDWTPPELWGKPVYSITQTVPMHIGPYTCHLNPDSPRKEEMNDHGLSHITCSRRNLPNEMALEQHMRSTHRQEYAIIERAEQRFRENQLLDLQRKQADALTALLEARTSATIQGLSAVGDAIESEKPARRAANKE